METPHLVAYRKNRGRLTCESIKGERCKYELLPDPLRDSFVRNRMSVEDSDWLADAASFEMDVPIQPSVKSARMTRKT